MSSGTLARALRRDALSHAFDAAGVAFKCLGGPIAPSFENTPIVQMDVHETPRCGEYIRVWPGAADNELEVVAQDRSLGQVVLRVREAQRPFTRRILRDRWRPEGVQEAEIVARGGSLLGRDRTHHHVQFLTPDEERLYLCGRDERRLAEALARDPHALRPRRSVGAGGEVRPHVADEVVVLRRARPRGERRRLPATVIFARGEVRHVDHAPVRLPDFRRVVLNTAVQPGREERRLRWFD